MALEPIVDYADLGERVYEAIREQIVRVQLPPGSRVQVVDLARQLNVSRTPVADALQVLEAEGLVESLPRRGYIVVPLDVDDYLEMLDARLAIELAAAERGIQKVDEACLKAMQDLNARLASCLDNLSCIDDFRQWSRYDTQFHQLLVGCSQNRHLAKLYRRLGAHVQIARIHFAARTGHRPTAETLGQHAAIVDALGNRDLDALNNVITEHIQGAARFYAAAMS